MKKITIFILLTLTIFDSFSQDTYNSSNNQLTIPLVQVGNTIYSNAVITVGNVVSIGPSSSVNTQTINLINGWNNLIKNGLTVTLNLSRTDNCIGTETISYTPSNISTTFQNQSALQRTKFLNINYFCSNTVYAGQTIYYYDNNYNLLGSVVQSTNGAYIVVQNYNIPSFIRLGDKGFIGNYISYSNSSMTTPILIGTITFKVEPYDANNLIFNYIETLSSYTNNTVQNIEEYRYLLNSNGNLSFYSQTQTLPTANQITIFTRK